MEANHNLKNSKINGGLDGLISELYKLFSKEFLTVPVKFFKRAKLQNNLGEGPLTENDTKHSRSLQSVYINKGNPQITHMHEKHSKYFRLQNLPVVFIIYQNKEQKKT